MTSRKLQAKSFKKWVTKKVFSIIRKTSGYKGLQTTIHIQWNKKGRKFSIDLMMK